MPERQLKYVPGLDGIRAFAVLAVMGYHNFAWLPGGFYGVDAFFVLSGFLITSLLVSEWQGSDTVRLGRFWARRARRLLPALFVLVAAIGLVAAVWPSVFGPVDLLPNALATIFYSANWYFISGHASYFAALGSPSPLLHTWSLAIEEQFYLVWPLVVLVVLKAGSRRSHPRRLEWLLALASVGAIASALWMAVLAPIGGGTTRAYYGTDTRAQGLLVGAALAVVFARWGSAPFQRVLVRRGMAGLAFAGVVGTALLWWLVSFTSSLAFHGGFLLAAIAAAAVIAGVVQAPGSPVPVALAWWPLGQLGRISYGVYLWYWPVLLVMSPQRMQASGWLLFGERVAVTVAIAAVSYRLVEMPIRRGRFPGWRALVAAPVAAGLALTAVVVATLVPLSQATPVPVVTSRGPASAHPVKVLLVGDSVAGTLGVGLGQEAPGYGIQLVDEGTPGCSVSMDQQFRVLGYTVAPGRPCKTGDPGALLAQWRQWVDAYNPDVVVYLARGETFDQEVEGQWSNLGEGSFDTYVTQRFKKAVGVLGSKGAAVVLMTTPYYDSGQQPDGAPWPEDVPDRVTIDNSIIRRVAGTADSGVRVFDLNALVSPDGGYSPDVNGVDLRCLDGVHFTAAAGEWLAPRLLPELAKLGKNHQASSPGGSWPGPQPPAVPSWWKTVPCGPA
jgi:peptidoglycan/LPS O-acetylase OafA/YrhL